MEITAKAKHIRMSARKVRLVVDVVRGNQVLKALDQLKFVKKLAVKPVSKLINSAIANAENNFNLERNNLFIKAVSVDDGVTLDRWMPRAHGRATRIRKKACHINLTLAEIKDSGDAKPKKQKIEAPVRLGGQPKEDEGVKVSKKAEVESQVEAAEEKGAKLSDPRSKTGRSGHARVEGASKKGFVGKMFNRKSG